MANPDDRQFFDWLKAHDDSINCVFDVGAHVGNWSRTMARFFPDATYHLFEPRILTDNETAENLKKNAAHYNHFVTPKAVGDKTGVAQFSVQGDHGVGSSLLLSKAAKAKAQNVEVISLDDYCSENRIESVDFMKMDIQGGELDALKGASSILPKTKYLFLETWLVSSYGEQTPSIFEILDFLREFDIFALDFFGGYRTPHGNLAHIDVVYLNANLSKLPDHFYRSFKQRIGSQRD